MDFEDTSPFNTVVTYKLIAFHHRIGAPIHRIPTLPTCNSKAMSTCAAKMRELCQEMKNSGVESSDYQLQRAAMAAEEFAEWLEALAKGDLVAAADAFGDRLFLLFGDAISMGLPIEPLFHEIARSNITKLRGVTTGHGKGAKGPGYEPPRIAEILERHSKKSEDQADPS